MSVFKMTAFDVIVASTNNGVIGIDGDLPWKRELKEDLQLFRSKTQNAALIMGSKTAISLPSPVLPGRISIVVTNNAETKELLQQRLKQDAKNSLLFASTFKEALSLVIDRSIFVIGGKHVFEEAFQSPHCRKVYWTKVYKQYTPSVTQTITQLDTIALNPGVFELVKESELKTSESGIA